jgi:hypothetical protein
MQLTPRRPSRPQPRPPATVPVGVKPITGPTGPKPSY